MVLVRSRSCVAGLSAGNAIAAIQGGGTKSGAAASGVPVIVFHGDANSAVNLA